MENPKILQKTDRGMQLVSIAGIARSDGILLPDNTLVPSATPLDQLLVGDVILAYIENGRMVPYPRKMVYANPSLDPELNNAVNTTATFLNAYKTQIESLLKKVKDPKVLQADLQPLLDQLVQTKQTATQSQVNAMLNPNSPAKIRVAKVNLNSASAKGRGIVKNVKLVTPTAQEDVNSRLDTGAEENLLASTEQTRINAPVIGKIALQGITGSPVTTDLVAIRVAIDNHQFDTQAAVFPDLEKATGARLLIGEDLFIKGTEKHINWLKP